MLSINDRAVDSWEAVILESHGQQKIQKNSISIIWHYEAVTFIGMNIVIVIGHLYNAPQ